MQEDQSGGYYRSPGEREKLRAGASSRGSDKCHILDIFWGTANRIS